MKRGSTAQALPTLSSCLASVFALACSTSDPSSSQPQNDAGFLELPDFGARDSGAEPDGRVAVDSGEPGRDAGFVRDASTADAFIPKDAGTIDAAATPDAEPADAGFVGQRPGLLGDLVITEIMQDPTVLSDAAGEWVELFNPSGANTYNLAGCVLSDLGVDDHTIASSVVVPPLSFVTLTRSSSPGFQPDYVYSGFVLSNADDEVSLSCGSVEIDRVAYDGGPLFPDPSGASMSLDPLASDSTGNDDGANWCPGVTPYNGVDLGSPGLSNPACP